MKMGTMYQLSIRNLFLSIILIFLNLLIHLGNHIGFPTGSYYYLFIEGNKLLFPMIIYLILSVGLFIYSRHRRNKLTS